MREPLLLREMVKAIKGDRMTNSKLVILLIQGTQRNLYYFKEYNRLSMNKLHRHLNLTFVAWRLERHNMGIYQIDMRDYLLVEGLE
jgi:hypothetical protein